MKNQMLLLEVRHYKNGNLFKRRISDSYYSIEEWLYNNASNWASGEFMLVCDEYCRGQVYFNNKPLFAFETTNIAVI